MQATLEATSVVEAHSIIEKFSETKSTTVVRKIPKMEVGQAARQGDIYIRAIAKIPKGYLSRAVELESHYQLVDGHTQGSKHIIVDTSALKAYLPENVTNELLWPVIEAKDCFTITHPEHAHFEMQPGLYQVTFQENWEEKERRVRD